MRKPLTVMAVAVMATIGFVVPAQATVTDVNRPFHMAYGNSTTSGTVHFTDGYSASVSGAVHAASGSRKVCLWGENGDVMTTQECSPWAEAGGPNQSFSETVTIARSGGVQRIYIRMYDANITPIAGLLCTRNGCVREF